MVIYPNPVTNSTTATTIELNLPSSRQNVQVLIFTTAFRKVNGIALSNVPEGVTDVPFNLVDQWGAPLANGLYYVVIRTPQGDLVAKLLVIR